MAVRTRRLTNAVALAEPRGQATSSCDANPEVGGTYLFVLDSLEQGYLGVANVPVQIRGDRLDGTFVDTEDFDLAGLIALLEGLPDASMSPPQPTDPPLTGIGAAVTLVGLTRATRKHFSRLA